MHILIEAVNSHNVKTTKRVNLDDNLLSYAKEQLIASPLIRSARIWQELFYTHKSFPEDFEFPLEDFPLSLDLQIVEGDFQIFEGVPFPNPMKDAIVFTFYDAHILERRIEHFKEALSSSKNGEISIGNVELLLEDLSVLLERSHRLESLEK